MLSTSRARTRSTFLYGNTSTYLHRIESKGFLACSKRWPATGVRQWRNQKPRNDVIFDDAEL
jgi:hypothetical protein